MDDLVASVRRTLRDHADPSIAAGQQSYMKSTMPFLGVRVPEVRRLTKAAARAHPPSDLTDLERSARTLWDEATHREERYAATAFFIRKAIGWALREAARVDPDWVRTFVDAHELSPLSRREALKHL